MREPLQKIIETEISSNALVVTCGLPVTCKTPIAEIIAKAKGQRIIRTDLLRKEVLKDSDIFDEKVASDIENRMAVYSEALRRADEILNQGYGVVIDATFVTQSLRLQAAALANTYGRTFVILQTHCSREVSLQRIKKRTREDYESNALTEQAYTCNENMFEKVDLDDIKRLYPNLDIVHLIVDTQYDMPGNWYVISIEKR